MAIRWQIIKKTSLGIFRATAHTEAQMRAIVEVAQQDPETKYVVVKDRVKNRRGIVWRRSKHTEIDWWILEDTPIEVEYKRAKKNEDPSDL
jgi:hypothetical protein